MTGLPEDVGYFIEKYGKPMGGEAVPASVQAAYADRVPPMLLEFWEECGAGVVLDGYFQLCRPDKWQDLLELILKGDPDYDPNDCTMLGYSAFGKLLIWHQSGAALKISICAKTAIVGNLGGDVEPTSRAISLGTNLTSIEAESYDYLERPGGRPLFERARRKLGPLAYGQCYGFVPALELGGRETLDDLHIRDAYGYFRMVAELGPIRLDHVNTKERRIDQLRYLGRQEG